ncbi:MAG: hypothetical protein H0W22_04835, partial [Chloroflexi bacterium]|nr:hypothetical protein [Chloroflexota bacterium]
DTAGNSGDPTCFGGDALSGNGSNDSDLSGGPLPDTASLTRTGTLVMAASIPLLLIAGALLGAWLVASRRRREPLTTSPADSISEGQS